MLSPKCKVSVTTICIPYVLEISSKSGCVHLSFFFSNVLDSQRGFFLDERLPCRAMKGSEMLKNVGYINHCYVWLQPGIQPFHDLPPSLLILSRKITIICRPSFGNWIDFVCLHLSYITSYTPSSWCSIVLAFSSVTLLKTKRKSEVYLLISAISRRRSTDFQLEGV